MSLAMLKWDLANSTAWLWYLQFLSSWGLAHHFPVLRCSVLVLVVIGQEVIMSRAR